MINLLNGRLTQAEIAQVLLTTPVRSLLPPMGDRVWARVAANPTVQKWMEPVKELALKESEGPMPPLSDSLYGQFYADGQRLGFENRYLERRRMLARAAICALIEPGEIRWIDSTLQKAEEILSEFSWALPAHINAPSGKDPMHIDIMAAETANLMGELITLFGARMPSLLRSRIYTRLRTQFFENYIERHFDFWWTEGKGHWNPVCHQGVVGAALAIEPDMQLVAKILTIARAHLRSYVEGFGNDGGCAEGVGYWQYGVNAFANLNRQIEVRTDTRLSFFDGDDRIRKIARFGTSMMLEGFQFVNFSDSPRKGGLNPALLIYLGSRLEDEVLTGFAHRSYARLAASGLNLHTQRSDLPYLARLLLNCPERLLPDTPLPLEDVFFQDLGMVVSRFKDEAGHTWEFAAKGGHNAEHQNHNDCGSYLLNIDGVAMVTEIGAPEYSKEYFRDTRYQFLAARSSGHSVPLVNGLEQGTGTQFAAKVLNTEFEAGTLHFSMDLRECYPQMAGIGDLARTFTVDKVQGALRVRDDYELSIQDSFETAILCDGDVDLLNGVATIRDGTVAVEVKPDINSEILTFEELEYRDSAGTLRTINRIVIVPTDLGRQSHVQYEIRVKNSSRK